MPKGRPKKPDAMHKLEGTERKDRGHGQAATFPPMKAGAKPPDWLGAEGKRKWQELIAFMAPVDGLLAELDREALAAYCEAWQEFTDAAKMIAESGIVCVSEKGGLYQSPAVGIKNQALKRMADLRAQFGMSPTARQTLKLIGNTDEETSDPFTDLLRDRMHGNN